MRGQRVTATYTRHRVVERESLNLQDGSIKPIFVVQKRLFFFFWIDTVCTYNTEHYACERASMLSRIR